MWASDAIDGFVARLIAEKRPDTNGHASTATAASPSAILIASSVVICR